MVYALDTNLADLPLILFKQLADCLSQDELWLKIHDVDCDSPYYSSIDEIDRLSRTANVGETLLRVWGNRGLTVHSLLSRLQLSNAAHNFSSIFENPNIHAPFDKPQLILKRKFVAVAWAVADKPVHISYSDDNQKLIFYAGAVGFPCPRYEWRCDGEEIIDAKTPILNIIRCKCELSHTYSVRVWNEVESGWIFSDFYRLGNQDYRSEILLKKIDIVNHVNYEHVCDRCKQSELDKIREIMGALRTNESVEHLTASMSSGVKDTDLVAADKVALIISNCVYTHLPPLVTPHCDAELLAQALQEMNFKTVTLSDLNIVEMRLVIKEYRKLLGSDVYAVLYFAGHGFEVNGQCYLLPVDAPLEAHDPNFSISMDWVSYFRNTVLAMLSDFSPALHLILLDVCRKYIPLSCISAFIEEAEMYKKQCKPNRNTVYGYSTSGGVGAYEVRGEMNGVFMNHLKPHITLKISVVDMLHRVLKDIEADERVRDVQIPELRTTLTKPRSLTDPVICDGHTMSFDHHTIHWRLMHELPNPVNIRFNEEKVLVTVWFDYCGHFTNKVYVFSSVSMMNEEGEAEEKPLQPLPYLAHLKFPKELDASKERVFSDEHEGESVCLLLSHLQRSQGEIRCVVQLTERDSKHVVREYEQVIGHVLITRLGMNSTVDSAKG